MTTDPLSTISRAIHAAEELAWEAHGAVRGPRDPLRASIATNEALDAAAARIDACERAMAALDALEKALADAEIAV